MADQSSEFTELVQEALRGLPQGSPAELVDQEFDEENFGNAVATLDLHGLRFRFARDRGFVTVDVGLPGQDSESFPLEDLAVKLEWLRREELEAHYGSLESQSETDGSRPPLHCHTWDLVQEVLQEESAWEALREACIASAAEIPQLTSAHG